LWQASWLPILRVVACGFRRFAQNCDARQIAVLVFARRNCDAYGGSDKSVGFVGGVSAMTTNVISPGLTIFKPFSLESSSHPGGTMLETQRGYSVDACVPQCQLKRLQLLFVSAYRL
jgi:hypothetical protein